MFRKGICSPHRLWIATPPILRLNIRRVGRDPPNGAEACHPAGPTNPAFGRPRSLTRSNLLHVNGAAFARALNARYHDGQVSRRPPSVGFRLAAVADASGKLLKLVTDGIGRRRGDSARCRLAPAQIAQAAKEIVVSAGFLAVDVH